jgi:hypothetical protein
MTQAGILPYASALPPGNLSYLENSTLLPQSGSQAFYWETVLVPVIWGILILIGGIGNGLVIYVIVFHGERRVTHCYIVNLAITDLAFLFFCVPFTMTFYALPQWIFGNLMCKFVMYIIYVSIQCNLYFSFDSNELYPTMLLVRPIPQPPSSDNIGCRNDRHYSTSFRQIS